MNSVSADGWWVQQLPPLPPCIPNPPPTVSPRRHNCIPTISWKHSSSTTSTNGSHRNHVCTYCIPTLDTAGVWLVSLGGVGWGAGGQGAGGQGVVTYASHVEMNQNEIKWSTFFLGANQGIKTNSEWLISTDQCTFSDTKEVWLFCPLNSHRIKQSRTSIRSDQVIKDDFCWSGFLIPVANASTGSTYVTTPWGWGGVKSGTRVGHCDKESAMLPRFLEWDLVQPFLRSNLFSLFLYSGSTSLPSTSQVRSTSVGARPQVVATASLGAPRSLPTENLALRVQYLESVCGSLQREKKGMEEEFGRQRKKFMNNMIQMEAELNLQKQTVEKFSNEVRELSTQLLTRDEELNNLQMVSRLSDSSVREMFDAERVKYEEEIASLRGKIEGWIVMFSLWIVYILLVAVIPHDFDTDSVWCASCLPSSNTWTSWDS